MTAESSIERASAIDMMELAAATTAAAGQVGAVMVLAPGAKDTTGLDLETVREVLARRTQSVPRLRQRLRSTPPGCGRPIWVDDPGFDISAHVTVIDCPPPGDLASVLEQACELVATELPRQRPLWAAQFVTGLADGTSALLIVFHHVMADGMGGLAVLANLVDSIEEPATESDFPRPAPRPAQLFADAMRSRLSALARPASAWRSLRSALRELGSRPPKAPHCSLNAPVGSRRRLALARTDLEAVHSAARAHGVSINDAALAAVTGSLARHMAERGEDVEDFVVSIPVSARGASTASQLGNQIGVMAVQLPGGGTPGGRMEAIGSTTRSHRQKDPGASAALLAPLFRLLAATRTFGWFTEHQHMVNTFVTNLRGPDAPVSFCGHTVESLLPLNSTSGNVRVAFGVFSYAGELTVTLVADGSFGDELDVLASLLQQELEAVCATADSRNHHASGFPPRST